MKIFSQKLSILVSLVMKVLGKEEGSGSQWVIQANFVVQSNIGDLDFRVQIEKFWSICTNLNFTENSFYPFPCLFRQNKLCNGASYSTYKSKIFFFSNHAGVMDSIVDTIVVFLNLVTTLRYSNSNLVLDPESLN